MSVVSTVKSVSICQAVLAFMPVQPSNLPEISLAQQWNPLAPLHGGKDGSARSPGSACSGRGEPHCKGYSSIPDKGEWKIGNHPAQTLGGKRPEKLAGTGTCNASYSREFKIKTQDGSKIK